MNEDLSAPHRTLLDELLEKHGLARTPATGSVAGRDQPEPGELLRPLTGRQVEVLAMIADGWTNAEIASELFLSIETVKSHLRKLLASLQAANRAHAVALGYEQGILPLDEPPHRR